jgi:hypothetical protein
VALNDHPEVTLSWADMIGTDGLTIWSATGKVKILLQASMSVLRATCVLTHELIHVEDGRRYTEDTPLHEIDVLERFVREETARRLVPPAELAWFLTRPRHRVLHRGYVAAYFGVTRAVGDLALQMLVENARDLSLLARAVVSDAMA